MKKLLLITGDLATGKSTFAGQLSQRYGCAAFCKDNIKEILGDTVGYSNREENLKLSVATAAVMLHIFERIAPLGRDLILEANFRTTELEKLHNVAEGFGYSVLTLVLRAELDTLHKRYLYRKYNENRHHVHLSTSSDDFEDFKGYIEGNRREEIPGRVLDICADDFSYQTNEETLRSIDDFTLRN